MSGFEVATYMAGAIALCAIPIAIAMVPAFLLVITQRFAGRLAMCVAAVIVCVASTYFYLNWLYDAPDRESYLSFFAWAALAFGSMVAAIIAGIGRQAIWRQTMAAASAALFVPVTLVLLGLAVFGKGPERLMAAGGVALAAYLVFRHWHTRARPVVNRG